MNKVIYSKLGRNMFNIVLVIVIAFFVFLLLLQLLSLQRLFIANHLYSRIVLCICSATNNHNVVDNVKFTW